MSIITLQPDAVDGEDSYVDKDNPDTNYDTGAIYLETTGLVPTEFRSSLLKFTLPVSIPPGSTIRSAILQINFVAVGGLALPYEIGRCTKPWVEDEVTYNSYATGSAWDNGHIEGAGNTDTTHAVSGNLPTSIGWFPFADIKDLAQDALDLRDRILNLHVYRTSDAG
jgi:hypothetical protein